LNKKGLTAGIILLFIGVAIAPSINLISARAFDDNNLIQSSYQTRLDPIIWDNYEFSPYDSISLCSQLDPEYPWNSQVADDFILENNSRVTGVRWWGCWWGDLYLNPCDFNIIFYADDGTSTMPTGEGMEDPTSTALAVYFMPQVNGTVCDDPDFYEYNVSLPTSFNITADTKYWIAIQEISELYIAGQWGLSTNGNSNPDQLHCPVQGFPILGTPYWTDTTYGDMAFQLYGGLNYAPLPPVITGPLEGDIDVSYTFWTYPVEDPSGDALYCRWDWGDGNITDWDGPYPSGSVFSASHSWSLTGNYEIRAKVKGIGGESNWSEPHIISISHNKPPVADFTYTVDELTVVFNATSSFDPDGTITTWLWDFGDGIHGPGELFTHTYSASGTYNVTLTVKDDSFEEASITRSVSVEKIRGALIVGKITDLSYIGGTIIFDAVKIYVIIFRPYSAIAYTSGEQITILSPQKGFLGIHYIFAFCMKNS
jgi:PKD domain